MTWYGEGKVADGPEGLLHSARVYKGSMCAVYCVVTSESVNTKYYKKISLICEPEKKG